MKNDFITCDICTHNRGNDMCDRQAMKDRLEESDINTKEFGKSKECPFCDKVNNSDVYEFI